MGRTMTEEEGARGTALPNAERDKLAAPLPEKLPIPRDGVPPPIVDDGRVRKFVADGAEKARNSEGTYIPSERRRFRRTTKPG